MLRSMIQTHERTQGRIEAVNSGMTQALALLMERDLTQIVEPADTRRVWRVSAEPDGGPRWRLPIWSSPARAGAIL